MPTTYRSFAKVNLHLEVVARRSDGFHELRTVFQTVSLSDLMTVSVAAAGVALEVRGNVPAGPENLVHRAASAFLHRWGGDRGVRIALEKRIPVAAGLGGGSSNAATTLLALRELFGRPANVKELVELAAAIGADVPYFLVGGTAVGIGRGDRVEEVPDLPEEELWLVDPGITVSTAEVFRSGGFAERTSAHPTFERVRRGEVPSPAQAVGVNDLQAVALERYAPVKAVYTSLVQFGAQRVQVSGSGGTVFAFLAGEVDERELLASLPEASRAYRVRTLSRASLAARRVKYSMGEP